MKKILDSYRVCSQFLDYLRAFGFKVNGEDENFHGFDSLNTFSGTRYLQQSNLRSILNVRITMAPWCRDLLQHSLCCAQPSENRESMVHATNSHLSTIQQRHRFHPLDIGPALRIRSIIPQTVSEQFTPVSYLFRTSKALTASHDAVHFDKYALEVISQRPRREVITTGTIMPGRLKNYAYVEQENKAMVSRVGIVHKDDFLITFRDAQAVERLRKKLLQARAILESSFDVASAYIEYHDRCLETKDNEDRECFVQLEAYNRQITNHLRTVARFLALSKGVSRMVCAHLLSPANPRGQVRVALIPADRNTEKLFEILKYRNSETIGKTNQTINTTNQAIHQNGLAIRELTVASIRENEIIAQLTERAWRDSRSVRILTFIALLYLPATLIAVSESH